MTRTCRTCNPTTLHREEAIAAALAAAPGAQGGPTAVGLEARAVAGAWRAVWSVTFSGSFPDLHCTATGGCPGPLTVEVVLIDAINGGVMGYEAPSP